MAKVKPGGRIEINGTVYRAGDELPKVETKTEKSPVKKEKAHGSSVPK